jgi:hypothetical protein
MESLEELQRMQIVGATVEETLPVDNTSKEQGRVSQMSARPLLLMILPSLVGYTDLSSSHDTFTTTTRVLGVVERYHL